LQRAVAGTASLALLWLVFSLWAAGQALLAVGLLTLGGSAIFVYGTAQSVAWKYLFPGIAGMLVFVAFPLLYTVQIGFTNYSSSNLLDEARARNYLLEQTVADEAHARTFTLHAEGKALRLKLMPEEGSSGEVLVSPPLNLSAGAPAAPVLMQPLGAANLAEPLTLKALIPLRDALAPLQLQTPDGKLIRYAGLREFGPIEALWQASADGGVTQLSSATTFSPNRSSG
jgi:maltose/maltodextrin transport system permease protein